MIVRGAGLADRAAIRACNDAAFGQVAEGKLVDALRNAGDGLIELVVDDAGSVVGHVLLSRLRSPRNCAALAPLSVVPHRQRQGVGASLVRRAVADARDKGFAAIFLVGEPAYYARFGFSVAAAGPFASPYPKDYTMALALRPLALDALEREIVYADAFAGFE